MSRREIMSSASLAAAARNALRSYSIATGASSLRDVGNNGGFSGARLWRVETSGRQLCLRAWPAGGTTPERLRILHELMKRARESGLAYVPGVFAAADGTTATEHAGRLWELTDWLPGKADFHDRPTTPRLEAACAALARLHTAWAGGSAEYAPCPAVLRRIGRAREWLDCLATGWQPDFRTVENEVIRPAAEQLWRLLQGQVERIPLLLQAWAQRSLPLQPCLSDVWHDHVLYIDERVTGLIDYGSVRVDHVTADLARLLGSLVGDDAEQRQAGLRAYGAIRALPLEHESIVDLLDRTGTVLAAANWLMWLYREGRSFEDPGAVGRRLATLVERIERRRL